jgi:hypothetical protein
MAGFGRVGSLAHILWSETNVSLNIPKTAQNRL